MRSRGPRETGWAPLCRQGTPPSFSCLRHCSALRKPVLPSFSSCPGVSVCPSSSGVSISTPFLRFFSSISCAVPLACSSLRRNASPLIPSSASGPSALSLACRWPSSSGCKCTPCCLARLGQTVNFCYFWRRPWQSGVAADRLLCSFPPRLPADRPPPQTRKRCATSGRQLLSSLRPIQPVPVLTRSFSSCTSPIRRSSASTSSHSSRRKVHLLDDPDDCQEILRELFLSSSPSPVLAPSPLTTYLMVQNTCTSLSPSAVASLSSGCSNSFSVSASSGPSQQDRFSLDSPKDSGHSALDDEVDSLPSLSPSRLFSPSTSSDLSKRLVAIDCEGVSLGRFGRLCTLQLATTTHTLVLDALKDGVVAGNALLKDILESPFVLKICHDCREDASALLHQQGIKLRNVFDTQVAHQLLCEKNGDMLFQASLAELFRTFLNLQDKGIQKTAKAAMDVDSSVWFGRPLSIDLLRYAVYGVTHLIDLAHVLSFRVSSDEVVRRTNQYLRYRHLNCHYRSAAEIATRGAILQGMVAARTCSGLTLKLNCGRSGVVSTPAALSRFHDIKIGDIVDVQVASQSIDGQIVYLDRYDGLYDYWNLKERPRTRFQTGMALTHESKVDPLLLLNADEEES